MPSVPSRPATGIGGPNTPRLVIDGGIVATDDAQTIASSIQSLALQALPPGVVWGRFWVVISGSTDGSEHIVRNLASRDPRIQLLVEPARRGKARALRSIMGLSAAELLVLLNGDAQAAPGALREMLSVSGSLLPPFAVMARPVVPALPPTLLADSLQLLWYFHHRLHEISLGNGEGNHLSDELLVLSHPPPTELPGEVVNDGAYLGASLRLHGGGLHYATQARVIIQVPSSVRGLLKQRTRIRAGHTQIRELTGQRPTTLPRFLIRHPREAVRWFQEVPSEIRRPVGALLLLGWVELVASFRGWWEWGHPTRDPVIWPRLGDFRWTQLVSIPEPVEGDGGELHPPRCDQSTENAFLSPLGPQGVIPPETNELEIGRQWQEQ